jgi:FkbM family methyltransferase
VLSKLIRLLIVFLAKFKRSLPESISIDMNRILGRGFGAASIESEVASALSLLEANHQKQLVVFDIGANVGNYSEELLKSSQVGAIYCFEPSLQAANSLTLRFQKNPKVHILNVALGQNEHNANLFSDTDASGLASLTKRRIEHFGIEFSLSQEVKVRTLKNVIDELDVIPDFIKIDVEGHELDVLVGAGEMLKHIKLVQFEFGGANIDTRTYFQDFWYFFKEQNFELFRIAPSGVIKVERYTEEDEYFKTTNFLAKNNKSKRI